MRCRQTFAAGAFLFTQKRHGIQPESIDAAFDPEIHHIQHRLLDQRVVVVEIRLMTQESMEVVLPGYLVPFPVG